MLFQLRFTQEKHLFLQGIYRPILRQGDENSMPDCQSSTILSPLMVYLRHQRYYLIPKHHPLQHSTFLTSLSNPAPPEGCSTEVASLWWLKNRNWQLAHDLIDQAPGPDAAWIHALLHRMEGDQGDASYWYARAGRIAPENTIGQELALMMDHFLD